MFALSRLSFCGRWINRATQCCLNWVASLSHPTVFLQCYPLLLLYFGQTNDDDELGQILALNFQIFMTVVVTGCGATEPKYTASYFWSLLKLAKSIFKSLLIFSDTTQPYKLILVVSTIPVCKARRVIHHTMKNDRLVFFSLISVCFCVVDY